MIANATITVTDAQGVSTSCRVCAFPASKGDALDPTAAESDTLCRAFVIPLDGEGGWNNPEPPVVGLRVTAEGVDYRVYAVSPFLGCGWHLEARQC